MNGQVGLMFQESDFQFLGKKALGQRRGRSGQGGSLQPVTGGFEDFDLELQFRKRRAALVKNEVRLGERERAAACGDDYRFCGRGHAIKSTVSLPLPAPLRK